MEILEVKDAIVAQLRKLGYGSHRSSIATSMVAMLGCGEVSMRWEIKGAGQKSFEATVRSETHSDFLIPCHADGKHWFAFARFRRDINGIKAFIAWLGAALKSHAHLIESLNPGQLPLPFIFQNHDFHLADHGYIEGGPVMRAKVTGLVTFDNSSVILTDASKPSSNPWFVINLHVHTGTTNIVTNGDNWYPIIENSNQKRILIHHGMMETLNRMNRRDHAIIQASIREFVKELERT